MTDYAQRLVNMTDGQLVGETADKVWLSSFAANNPRSKYHAECDACWAEAKRRDKSYLYQRGWNSAFQACGYTLSEHDIEAAKAPAP